MVIRANGEDRVIPEGWHDVTWAMYLRAVGLTEPHEIISAVIGIDILSLRHEHLELVMSRFTFWNTPIPPLAEPEPIDIGLRSWEDMNKANAVFAANPSNHYNAAAEVVRIYYGEDVTDEPVGYALPFITHILHQFDTFGKRFEDLGKDVPDDNMVAAGVDKINAFGWFPTLDTLASGDVLKYDLILQTPAITIYSKLLLDMVRSDYVKELNRLQSFAAKHGLHTDN